MSSIRVVMMFHNRICMWDEITKHCCFIKNITLISMTEWISYNTIWSWEMNRGIIYNYGLHEKLISIIIKLRKVIFPRSVLLYWTNMREITSYWFDVQRRANFKQLFCATCRFPHSYFTYVQFAAGIMSYYLFHEIRL